MLMGSLWFQSACLSFQGFDELGGLLKPTVASQNQSLPVAKVPPNKLVSDDLDSSLANLVGSKYWITYIKYLIFKRIEFQ